jgi:two-component system sensor kinase FixL
VSLTISPIRDPRGQVIGASKIVRDIGEQRAAQDRLVELQTELLHVSRLGTMGQMATAITHELIQPLSAVSNYLSGVVRRLSATDFPASLLDALNEARKQNQRAGEIVRRMRDLAVKRESNRRAENINDIVEQTLGLALVDAGLRGVKTTLLLAPGLDPVLVDKIQISQVILNIVRNAIEAMDGIAERGLTISTAIDPGGQGIEMRIADTGPGLPSQVKERLFQPFVTTKIDGMGIGLSICRDIIDSHDGGLSARPNEPNGTIFLIRLPAVEVAKAD